MIKVLLFLVLFLPLALAHEMGDQDLMKSVIDLCVASQDPECISELSELMGIEIEISMEMVAVEIAAVEREIQAIKDRTTDMEQALSVAEDEYQEAVSAMERAEISLETMKSRIRWSDNVSFEDLLMLNIETQKRNRALKNLALKDTVLNMLLEAAIEGLPEQPDSSVGRYNITDRTKIKLFH